MTKTNITIKGKNIIDVILSATSDFQQDEYVQRYDFTSGTIFMFEQFKRSLDNFVLNVIIDFSLNPKESNEILIQCIAMGGKDRGDIQFINLEKSIMVDFHAHFYGYRDRHNCDWEIGELTYEESATRS